VRQHREEQAESQAQAIDQRERSVIELAARVLVDEGGTTGDAVARLNALDGYGRRKAPRWTRDHLRRRLLSDHLTGTWVWAKTTKTGADPVSIEIEPILSLERHQQVKEALARTAKGPRKRGERFYPLSGRLRGLCGAAYTGWLKTVTQHRKQRMYRCRNTHIEAVARCRDKSLPADQVEGAVWEAVREMLSSPARLLAMAEDFLGMRLQQEHVEEDQLAELDRKISRREQALAGSLRELALVGVDAVAMRSATKDVQDELEALRSHRSTVVSWRAETAGTAARLARLRELADSAAGRLTDMGAEEQAKVYSLLDLQVLVLAHASGSTPACVRVEGRIDDRLDLGHASPRNGLDGGSLGSGVSGG